MKILHVVQGYTPAIGGTEYLIQKVSEKLVANHGDEVTVYTTTAYNCELFWRRDQPELPAGTEILNGVTVRRFPVFNRFNQFRYFLAGSSYKLGLPYNDWARAFFNGPLVPGMTKAIAHAGADVIAGSSFPLLHMHYMLRGGRQAGTAVTLIGGIHTADDFGFNRPMIYKAIRQADAYIAYTPFEQNYLVNEKHIPAEQITVIGVGVDMASFAQANGASIRQQFGWEDAPVLAFVGQQVPHKGIDMIQEAMTAVWQEFPDACLLIAGAQTTYSPTIERWAAALPPERRHRVGIIHNFTNQQKPHIFAACDVLLFPSGHESFGIAFVEAWATRKPVIGARIGAVTTVIEDGRDGLLIEHRNIGELAQAICQLLASASLRQQMGEAGYNKVKARYTWDIVAAQFREVYVRVVRNKQQNMEKEICQTLND